MNLAQKRWLKLVMGWGFVVLGIAGFVLPVLPGLFLAIGLIVLSGEYTWARNLLARLTARFPGLAVRLNHVTARARFWLARARASAQTP